MRTTKHHFKAKASPCTSKPMAVPGPAIKAEGCYQTGAAAGAMHYFVHFTLVVTLVTVQGTLAERSEVHRKGTGESQCIKSLDELINAFRRRETITGNHTNLMDDSTTIFDMELQYLLTYTMMFLTYQVSFSGNTTSYQCPVGPVLAAHHSTEKATCHYKVIQLCCIKVRYSESSQHHFLHWVHH